MELGTDAACSEVGTDARKGVIEHAVERTIRASGCVPPGACGEQRGRPFLAADRPVASPSISPHARNQAKIFERSRQLAAVGEAAWNQQTSQHPP